ncbi:hypothetical protein AGMMS49983_13950 [Clostridia bacterium]|nr:hypothetical protein AGMMS49983_13950 [Clostridia bacterium]
MYRTLGLLKKPLENEASIEETIKLIAEKLRFKYVELNMGEYGSKKDGFVPIYCMKIAANDYAFQINYQRGLGPFKSDKTKGFVRTDYNALIEIVGNAADTDMEHFNDFTLICENIEKTFDGILVEYNSDSKLWEKK